MPGGRLTGARRHVGVTAFLVLVAAAVSAAGDSESEAQVTVREEAGVYSVTARFHVPQPPAVALAVLTHYEDIPRFMPQIKASVVRERTADHVVVEQEAVSWAAAPASRS
jgi:hypothetical protein